MAIALEETVPPATAREVGDWVESVGGDPIRSRARTIADIEHRTLATKTGRTKAGRLLFVGIVFAAIAIPVAFVVRDGALKRTESVSPANTPLPITPSGALAPASAQPATPAAMPTPRAEAAPNKPAAGSEIGVETKTPAPAKTVTRPARNPARRLRAKDCDPPYVIDNQGFRAPKPECL